MIKTDRLLLRPYEPDDWERVHSYASIPEFSQFDVWGPNSVDDTKRFVNDCIAKFSEMPILRYELAVVPVNSGLLIGGCSLKLNERNSDEAALGFAIGPDYQNNGYATEAATGLIAFGFGQLGLSKIHAKCDRRNVASWRVMEKAGMRRTAVLPKDRDVKGAMTDSYRYEVFPADIE